MATKATAEQRREGRVGFAKNQKKDESGILEFPAAQVAAIRRKARRADVRAMKALRRKIENWITDRLNKQHALLEYGDDVVILTTRTDYKGNPEFLYRKDSALVKLYRSLMVPLPKITPGGKVSREYKNPVDIWLDNTRHRRFKGVVVDPGRDTGDYINLWQGWGTEPRRVPVLDADGAPVIGEDGNPVTELDFTGTACRRILNHIRDVLAGGDVGLYRWMLAWFADIIQDPADKKPSALLIYGPQGAGKSILSEHVFPRILKNAFSMERNTNFIKEDAGNTTAAGKLLIAAEEAIFAGDPRTAAELKTFISQSTIGLRKLYSNKVTIPNTARLMATVNPQSAGGHVVAMENDDRRWTIAECSAHRVGDFEYFKALHAEIANGGAEAFHAFLLNPALMDATLIQKGYESSSGIVQKILSLPVQEAFVYECLRSRTVQIGQPDDLREQWDDGIQKVGQQDFFKCYLDYCKDHKKQYPGTILQFNSAVRKLLKLDPDKDVGRYNNDGRYWKLPPISEARERFRQWIRCEDNPAYLRKLWDDYEPLAEADEHDEIWNRSPEAVHSVPASDAAISRQLDEEIPF